MHWHRVFSSESGDVDLLGACVYFMDGVSYAAVLEQNKASPGKGNGLCYVKNLRQPCVIVTCNLLPAGINLTQMRKR